jgi:uncharacterized protein (DUF2236 family)
MTADALDPRPPVAWMIQREVVLLAGWGRAILLQLAHPLVAQGVADHSAFLTERRGRWHRLYRTVDSMLRLSFGTPEDAARVVRAINAIHGRVHGRLPEPAGIFPAGTVYSARDPRLLCWVHATLLDSFLLTYELYVGPLRAAEKNGYCAEASQIAPSFEIPEGVLPASVADLERYMARMYRSGEIAVTGTARALACEIVAPAGVHVTQPFVWLNRLPTVGLLPPAIRQAYGFPWGPRREQALRLSAGCIRRLLALMPSVVRHWPSARASLRRPRTDGRGVIPGRPLT